MTNIPRDPFSWFLFQSVQETEFKDLSTAEVVKILATIPVQERSDWFVWREGFKEWVRLNECDDLLGKQAAKTQPPPLGPLKVALHKKTKESRKHPRLNIRLRVILLYEGQSFRTFTQNVSLGGILIQDPLPAFFQGKTCTLLVSRIEEKENIRLNAKVLTETDTPSRIQFDSCDQVFLDKLESWLKSNALPTPNRKLA